MGGPPWWQGRFVAGGYRPTLARQAILQVIAKTPGLLSAQEIFPSVRKIYPRVGLATVYRTLDILTRMGVLNRFDFGDGQSRYELITGDNADHHHHLICVGCGRIIDCSDFDEKEYRFIEKLEKELAERHNFRINSHQIHFYGLCEKCR
jgi:Fur family ferric uptake transcriptional regulator